MTVAKNKNTSVINTLRDALAEFGDVPLSVAIQKLREPPVQRPPGAPIKWTEQSLMKLLAGVEERKGRDGSTTAAFRAYAHYAEEVLGDNKLTPRTVERHYYHAKLLREFFAEIESLSVEQLLEVDKLLALPDEGKKGAREHATVTQPKGPA
jgi:hypothetical protein